MPEAREVFEMVRRQTEPAVHVWWEEQERRQRRVARNRKIGAISLSAALAVAVALFVLDGSDATDQRRETNQVAGRTGAIPSERGIYLFDLETRQATRVADIVSLKPTITVSPDGTTVAYQAMGAAGQEVIYLANVDGTHVRALKETAATGEPIGPRFSPDGSQIVFQAKGSGPRVGNLFLIDVGTGQTTQLTHLKQLASGLFFMGPSFSPDGETVLFQRPEANYIDQPTNFRNQSWGVWAVPATGGRPELVLRNAVGARLSPDGRRILYFKVPPGEGPVSADMWLADADGTDAQRLLRGNLQTLSAEWSPDGTKIAYARMGGRSGTYVLDVTTGETSKVLDDAYFPEWVDDHTLIVGPPAQ